MSQHEVTSSVADETTDPDAITLRAPVVQDGTALWQLVKRSGVLEENSCYAYLLLSTHFASTCVVAESGGRIVGFVAAYVPPTKPEVVFVWQIGVDSAVRRLGLGKRLLKHLVSLQATRGTRFLEATVTPSNHPSCRLFMSFAEELGVACRETDGFSPEDFGRETHEAERLLCIGPLPERPVTDGNV